VRYCLDCAGINSSDLTAIGVCTIDGNELGHDVQMSRMLRPASNDIRVVNLSHHLGHAAGVFATSGFDSAAILVVDGLGSPWTQLSANELDSVIRAQRLRYDWASPSVFEIISMYSGVDTSIVSMKNTWRLDEKSRWRMRRFFMRGVAVSQRRRAIFWRFARRRRQGHGARAIWLREPSGIGVFHCVRR